MTKPQSQACFKVESFTHNPLPVAELLMKWDNRDNLCIVLYTCIRALDKREYLMIIFLISYRNYML